MDMITAEEVIGRIELYFQGGAIKYLKGDENAHATPDYVTSIA
jgi:hypothetical protein